MSGQSRRRLLQRGLWLASVGLLAGCGVVPIPGQPASGGTSLRRIGYLQWSTAATMEPFRDGLRELGYVVGVVGDVKQFGLTQKAIAEAYFATPSNLGDKGPSIGIVVPVTGRSPILMPTWSVKCARK